MRSLLVLAALIWAGPVAGGAWLKAEGEGFLAYSAVYKESGRLDGSLYAEYGLRPKLTLGVKIDVDMTNGRMGDGTAFVFARKPIGVGQREFKLAYELGLGTTFGGTSETLLRTGLSYGRGIEFRDKYGWFAVDGAIEWTTGDGTDTAKLDTTLGLTLNDRFKVMMQVFFSQTETASTTTLASSVVWQPKEKARSYQLGVETQNGELALKLGLWRSF